MLAWGVRPDVVSCTALITGEAWRSAEALPVGSCLWKRASMPCACFSPFQCLEKCLPLVCLPAILPVLPMLWSTFRLTTAHLAARSSRAAALGTDGQWERAEKVVEWMLRSDIKPNVRTYSALITGALKSLNPCVLAAMDAH